MDAGEMTERQLDAAVAKAIGHRAFVEYGITKNGGESWLITFRDEEEAGRWLHIQRTACAVSQDAKVQRFETHRRYSENTNLVGMMLEWARENYSVSLVATCPLSSVLNCWAAGLSQGVHPPQLEKRDDATAWGYGATPQIALARAIAATTGAPE